MTAYLVRQGAQKKKGILGKRETELLHHIKNRSSDDKLAKAAENLRAAQNAVIKCMLHETEAVKPEDELKFASRRQRFEQERNYWESVPTAEIIEKYRNLTPKPEG